MALTRKQEVALLRKAKRGDVAARNALIEAHYGFVIKTAAHYKKYGATMEDMTAEGVLGLVEAIDRDDTRRSTRLLTHGIWAIRRGIMRAITEHQSLFNKKTVSLEGRMPERVRDHRLPMVSLDAPCDEENETDVDTLLGEILADDSADDPSLRMEEAEKIEVCEAFLSSLSARERQIVKTRVGMKGQAKTLESMATKLGISRERVRYIYKRAIRKLLKLAGDYE